jgi:hypothetical protein
LLVTITPKPLAGGAYGNLYLDIAGSQPERDIFCCHAFSSNVALACNFAVHIGMRFTFLRLSEKATAHTANNPFGVTLGCSPCLRSQAVMV